MIISIGMQCTNAMFKRTCESGPTMPFDWMMSHPRFVLRMLELLLEERMDVRELVEKHFFACDQRTAIFDEKNEHFKTIFDGIALLNTKYDVVFPHDHFVDASTTDKYIRRFERLKEAILHPTECLQFIYTSPSSSDKGNFLIDGRIIIPEAYADLNKIFHLIGKYNKDFFMFVFDAIKKEDRGLLDPRIVLVPLNACSQWSELLPQMQAIVGSVTGSDANTAS